MNAKDFDIRSALLKSGKESTLENHNFRNINPRLDKVGEYCVNVWLALPNYTSEKRYATG